MGVFNNLCTSNKTERYKDILAYIDNMRSRVAESMQRNQNMDCFSEIGVCQILPGDVDSVFARYADNGSYHFEITIKPLSQYGPR